MQSALRCALEKKEAARWDSLISQRRSVTPAAIAGKAWEAKEKREAKPIFEILEWKIGGGFYVKAIRPNREPENITGFATKDDARRWVRCESAAWIHTRRRITASERPA